MAPTMTCTQSYLINLAIISNSQEAKNNLKTFAEELFTSFPVQSIFVDASSSHLPFTILSTLITDLPLVVLIGEEELLDLTFLKPLERYASRIIFVPQQNESKTTYERLSLMLGSISCPIVDINFAHTKAWRRALKKVFDTPEFSRQLTSNPKTTIFYAENLDDAIYLQAYMAAQLHLPLSSIQLQKHSFAGIEITTDTHYHFQIVHENDKHFAKVYISSEERCEIPYTIYLSNFEKGPKLLHEVLFENRSQLFEKTVNLLRM